jgi:alkylation response protein AidB-like acyl-CoA dehydrogenase
MAVKFTEEQLSLKELAREFFEKEVRPVMAEIDARPNPKDCYPAELIRKASEIGLKTLPLPEEYEGVDADVITQALAFTAMTEVEPGTAKVMSQCWKVSQGIMINGNDEVKKTFLAAFAKDHDYVFSISITEPNAAGENVRPYYGVDGGVRVSAVPDGDYYVINGAKNMSSLAGFSKCVVVVTRTNRSVPAPVGTTAFLVPYNLPGITYGQVHNKMGYRAYPNGEIFFDKVRVPREYMIGNLNEGMEVFKKVPWNPVEMHALNLGMCKAIFKIALEHARQRVQGGKPIIEHESVGVMLGEMAMLVDVLEASLYEFAFAVNMDLAVDRNLKSRYARIFPRECLIRVMLLGMDVVASASIMRDHPMEKLIRDALTFLHGDGTMSMNRLRILPMLKDIKV